MTSSIGVRAGSKSSPRRAAGCRPQLQLPGGEGSGSPEGPVIECLWSSSSSEPVIHSVKSVSQIRPARLVLTSSHSSPSQSPSRLDPDYQDLPYLPLSALEKDQGQTKKRKKRHRPFVLISERLCGLSHSSPANQDTPVATSVKEGVAVRLCGVAGG